MKTDINNHITLTIFILMVGILIFIPTISCEGDSYYAQDEMPELRACTKCDGPLDVEGKCPRCDSNLISESDVEPSLLP